MKTPIKLAIIGAVIGIPLSYYFQASWVKFIAGSVFSYLQHFDKVLKHDGSMYNVLLSMAIFAALGFIVGQVVSKKIGSK